MPLIKWVVKYAEQAHPLKHTVDRTCSDLNEAYTRLMVWENGWHGQTYNYWVEEERI